MASTNGEESVEAALAHYFECLDRGEAVDATQLVGAFPQCAEELARFFANEKQLTAQFRALRKGPIMDADAFTIAMLGGNNRDTATIAHERASAGSGFNVRCPSCQATVSIAADGDLSTVRCSDCGSNFSLVQDGTSTQQQLPLTSLGRFDLLERLGMGAFGSVWKARDKELDRTVAIKIPRQVGMTAEDQEKFFREARAAAQLRHPNIVSVHEVGREGDSVYIVSDFVRGVTLSDWLTGQRPNSREAAELCAKIADALQHAHEKGVVHRDLKPANIMIDGDGQPHIMDFGLASRDVGEVSITMEGHILGTPAYMSPEQAEGRAHTADRRSDVYSLGVILFQLLTGELPFRGNARMLLHQVIHDEPPTPRKLNANISKDLETITLKCLEKEPASRYQTAKFLAEELRRFLSSEPIHARPVSRAERAVRWMGRNKTVSAASALAIVALVGGTVVSTIFAVDARRQAAAAVAAAAEEKKAKETASARQTETEAALDFLENKVFAAARPQGQEGGLGRDVTLRQAIESALPFVEESFTKQPLIEARLRMTLGSSFQYLGEAKTAAQQHEIARELLTRQLGSDHPDTLDSMNNLANAYREAGRLDEATPLLEETLAVRKKKLGPDHPDTLASMNNLAATYHAAGRLDEALPLDEETLAARRKKLGSDHPDTLGSMNNLAESYNAAGRLNEAIPLYEETLAATRKKLGPDHPDTLASMNNLANAYRKAGRLDEALPLHEETLAARRKKLGPDHPDSLSSMNNLAIAYRDAGRLDEALPLLEQTLAGRRKKLGSDHPDSLGSMNNLANAYHAAGRLDEALPLHKETLAARRKKLGPDHPDSLNSLNALAVTYHDAGRLDEALPLYEETLAGRRKKLGPDHPDSLSSMNNLAIAYRDADRLDEALPLLEQTLAGRRKKLGADHPDSLNSMTNLAIAYDAAGRLDEAFLLYELTLAAMREKLGADHADTISSINELANVYLAAGRLDEASRLNQQLLERGVFLSGFKLAARIGPEMVSQAIELAAARRDERTPQPLDALVLGELRLVAGDAKTAETAIRAAIQQDGNKHFFYKSLGCCLIAQGKTDEARNAFQEVIKDRKSKDDTYDLTKADPDQMTAAYFLDRVTEQSYTEHFASDKKLACFPWFYVAQRREIEGKKEAGIKAYERCVKLGAGDYPHSVRALAEWRLRKLRDLSPVGQK